VQNLLGGDAAMARARRPELYADAAYAVITKPSRECTGNAFLCEDVLAADARDMLGGNGILLDHHVIRHMADLEAIHTFEGTETMQTLIVGCDITGISASPDRAFI